jgi:hypothetical protein
LVTLQNTEEHPVVKLTDTEISRQVMEKLSVPLWPVAARALNLSRSKAYQAAATGEIPILPGSSRKNVPCPWLRKQLELPALPQHT